MSDTKKWFWMMHWCKSNGYPPAHKWAWDRANDAYNKHSLTSVEPDTTGVQPVNPECGAG